MKNIKAKASPAKKQIQTNQEQNTQKGLAKIEGILTSAIQINYKGALEPYCYGFFQLEGIKSEIPVIFKLASYCNNPEAEKPNIPPKAKVLLEGHWAESITSPRPSFTCLAWQIITNPSPPTLQDLFKQISSLLSISLKKQSEWKQRIDFLFHQRKELEEIDQLSKLGDQYLQAYLLLRRAFYSNYQDKLLPHNQFNQQEYLNKLASEIENIARNIRAYQSKEPNL